VLTGTISSSASCALEPGERDRTGTDEQRVAPREKEEWNGRMTNVERSGEETKKENREGRRNSGGFSASQFSDQ